MAQTKLAGVSQFFRASPNPIESEIGATLRHLYYCDHLDHLHLAADDEGDQDLPSFLDITGATQKALKSVYDGKAGLIEPNLFQLASDAIGAGVSMGVLQYGKPNPAFLGHMQKTGTWFAARKTYVQQQELARLLISDDGKTKRSWKQFQSAAKGIVSDYNERWLKTEYNTAIRAARNGSRWQAFEANRDLYPNLEYLPSRAATPRDDHKPFYHVIRPLDDAFWATHYPPSEYNCLCGAEPTDSAETPLPEKQPKPAPGLDHNPGQTEQVFSDSHPYTGKLKEQEADVEAIDKEGEDLQRQVDHARLKAAGHMFTKFIEEVEPIKESFPALDEVELASIRGYCDTQFLALNQWLQGKRISEPYLEAYNRVLQESLQKLPAVETTVYRGTDLSADELAIYKKGLKSKKPVSHPFYVSTAGNAANAFLRNTFIELKCKTGRSVEKISWFGTQETQILLPAGSQWKIKSIKKVGSKTVIIAEEV